MKKTEYHLGKRQLIVNVFRDKIVSGSLSPGFRMPTRRDIAERYKVTLVTAQLAFDELARDGFIVSKGRSGTFVADLPPHLNHFALVFPENLVDDHYQNRYWRTLAEVGVVLALERGIKLSIYNGVNKYHHGKDYDQMMDDVMNDCLAGIIFPSTPFFGSDTPIMEKPGIPRVAIMPSTDAYDSISQITLDSVDFRRKSVGFLKENGCRTAALLGHDNQSYAPLLEALAKENIECPYYYRHSLSLDNPEWAKHITRLLFNQKNEDRPDALMITNDHLFDHAVDGILDAGLTPGKDVKVLAHCNFPTASNRALDVTRIGWDIEQLLNTCFEELGRQREGKQPRSLTFNAIFEDEIERGINTARHNKQVPEPIYPYAGGIQ